MVICKMVVSKEWCKESRYILEEVQQLNVFYVELTKKTTNTRCFRKEIGQGRHFINFQSSCLVF